jgi:glucose/arabinose dehydrogenase
MIKKCIYLLSLVLLHASQHAFAQAPTLSFSPVITGLSLPTQMVHAVDGSGRLFVVQKGGSIRVYDKNFAFIRTLVTVPGITTAGERGLLSLAFHPNFASNKMLYVYYTNGDGDLEISRYTISDTNPDSADVASRAIVITIPHPGFTNHNGGEMHFGTDGLLYLSTGDGGGNGDPNNNALTLSSLLGKLLRIQVNTNTTTPFFSIPPSNPFGTLVYAWGLRNPFRWEFDRLTGDIWIGDVGQNMQEEVNHRLADSISGINFGWSCREGTASFNAGRCDPLAVYTGPVLTYPTPNPQGSVTGGTVYRGDTYINFRGWYVCTDYYSGRFYKIRYNSSNRTYDTASQVITPTGISDFAEDDTGELYAVCLNNGTVYRLVADGAIQYTFTGNGNWNNADNWSNKTIPPANLPTGTEIVIRPAAGGTCVLNVPQTIPAGTKITVASDKQFIVNGNLTIQQ